jgi:hypothetical protein
MLYASEQLVCDIKRLAHAAPDALLGPDAPEGTAVRAKLVERLEEKVDRARPVRTGRWARQTVYGD